VNGSSKEIGGKALTLEEIAKRAMKTAKIAPQKKDQA